MFLPADLSHSFTTKVLFISLSLSENQEILHILGLLLQSSDTPVQHVKVVRRFYAKSLYY